MSDKYQEEFVGMLGGAPTPNCKTSTIAEALQRDSMKQACRQSFTESLVSRIHRAESSAHEVGRLRRLAELFGKHPEVREMFELVRDLGVL